MYNKHTESGLGHCQGAVFHLVPAFRIISLVSFISFSQFPAVPTQEHVHPLAMLLTD